jgi:hypothetical protein
MSRTQAAGQYVAAGFGFDLRGHLLLHLGVSFTTSAGYSWFDNQAPHLGSFPLPPHVNWHAGVTFTHKIFNLDLRYYDTKSVERELVCLYRGSKRVAEWPRRSHYQSGWLGLELVRRNDHCQRLACVLVSRCWWRHHPNGRLPEL